MTISGRRALSAAAVLFSLFALTLAARPAAAAPIGSDGVVHACYKAKGKPKGALRVVKPGKKCKAKKGEKAIAWTVFGTPGATGSQGDTGAAATQGATKQDLLTLLGLIQQQSSVIDQLTGQLGALGVDLDDLTSQLGLLNGDVNGLESILSGVTNGELQSAINAVPVVTDLCDQLSAVTGQSDGLLSALGVVTNLLDPLVLGALPDLPDPLGAFSCA